MNIEQTERITERMFKAVFQVPIIETERICFHVDKVSKQYGEPFVEATYNPLFCVEIL